MVNKATIAALAFVLLSAGVIIALTDCDNSNGIAVKEDAASALQGKVAGLDITQTSGAPGSSMSIRVRGSASLNNNAEPLYVVDGVIFQMNNPLSTINPEDIVSMEVLKDAAATAIYGAEAANGVVIITTSNPGAAALAQAGSQAALGAAGADEAVAQTGTDAVEAQSGMPIAISVGLLLSIVVLSGVILYGRN